LNTTVSPRIGKQVDDLTTTGEFSSQSDLVSVALTEFFVREEQREHEKKMAQLYQVLVEHEEGRALLDEVPRTAKEKADALTKAGIAHVEAGEYEEAKKCFAKAKELEGKDDLPSTLTSKVVIE